MRQVVFMAGHLLATPAEIIHSWKCSAPLLQTQIGPIIIPPQYALGTAQHESNFSLDEVDTEPSGFTSYGIYQLSKEEARDAGLAEADLLDLDQASEVLARISAVRVLAIAEAAMKRGPSDVMNALRGDLYAYLSIAHNQGLGAALKTIGLHGLDWPAYKTRNLGEAQMIADQAAKAYSVTGFPADEAVLEKAKAKLEWWHHVADYGDDAISGGSSWPSQ